MYFEYICWKFAGRLLDRVYIHPITDVEETDKLQTLRETADDDDGGGVFVPRITLRPLPPLFLVSIWNVHERPDEAWNRGFAALVGRNHTLVWCTLESLHQDAAEASTTLLQNARGQLPAKHLKMPTRILQRILLYILLYV